MKDFVKRAKDRFKEIGALSFRKEAKRDDGPWKSGDKDLYLIYTDGRLALIHAGDQEAEDRNLEVVDNFRTLVNKLTQEGREEDCIMYNDHEGVADRYACAVKVQENNPISGIQVERILVGGLHHEKLPQENFDDLAGSGYVPDTEASDVVDAETLKSFVKSAVEGFKSNFNAGPGFLTRFRPVFRREDGPWREGDIYIFIMRDNNEVIFNANDPGLEDTSLSITDINNCNVGEEIIRVVRNEDRQCPELGLLPEDSQGFVEYRWDNPDDPYDDDLRFKEGGRMDLSPGITPKLAYVETFTAPLAGEVIVGAGVYPQNMTGQEQGNDGCAVSGDGSSLKNTASSLFLIGFFVVAAILLRNRLREKNSS